jgi:histidinol phosphatase-like PHP family hydrolase
VQIKTIQEIKRAFDPSILTFDVIRDLEISHKNIDELENLSNIAKMLEITFDKEALSLMES